MSDHGDESEEAEEDEDLGGIGHIPVQMDFGIACVYGGYIVFQESASRVFTDVDSLLFYIGKEMKELDRLNRENGG